MSKPDDKPKPASLNELFAQGFTVPPALRMNSVYGKHASDLGRVRMSTTAAVCAYLIAKTARAAARVI